MSAFIMPSDLTPEQVMEYILAGKKNGQRHSKADYLRHYKQRLLHSVLTQFRYIGLGDHVEPRFIEWTMARYGLGVFYMQRAGEVADSSGDEVLGEPRLTFQQGVAGGKLNDQWVTTEYRTIAPGGPSRVLRTAGELSTWGGIPLYDNIAHDDYTRRTIRFQAERLADAALTVDINLDNTRLQRIAVVTQDQVKSAQMLDDQIYEGNGTVVLKKGTAGASIADSMSVLDFAVDPNQVETSHTVFSRLLGEAYNALGIKAVANEKQAQITASEVSADDPMIAAIRMSRYDSRCWTIDKLNKRYGLEAYVVDTGTGESRGSDN